MTKDQNGNAVYDYDAWGRLRISGSSTNDYEYDALGRRILSDGTEWLIYSGSQVIEDRHVHSDGFGGTVVDSIDRQVWGAGYIDQMVLRDHYDESSGLTTRLYSLQDANFNTVAITDNAGTVQDRFAYDQNGSIRSGNPAADNWIYLWQGLIQVSVSDGTHPATVLYDGRSRFYNPQLGTWINPDRKGYIDGMNLYGAYDSNPESNVDPNGFDAQLMGGWLPPPGFIGVYDGTIFQPKQSVQAQTAPPSNIPGIMTPFAEQVGATTQPTTQPTTRPATGPWANLPKEPPFSKLAPPQWPAQDADRATRERFANDIALYWSKWRDEHQCCLSDPFTLAAQWMMESNWGRSQLTQATNNLGNIKGTGPAGTTSANTKEDIGGQDVTVTAGFRKYHNLGEFFDDYAKLICNNPRYKDARGKSGRAYFQALKDAGYATDPNYVDKAMQFYKQLGGGD